MDNTKHIKEPFVRLAKRDTLPLWMSLSIRAAAIALALVVCAIIINAVTGLNPLKVFASAFDGAFGTSRRFWNTARDTMALLLIALAITPAFKMRFWNVGAEGQVLVGGIATAAIMYYCGDTLPTALMFAIMLAVSLSAGMIWGIIPAVFKAQWNTNETLFTLMMNYIAIQLASFFSILWEAVKGSGSVGVINLNTKAGWISTSFLSGIFGKFNYSINLIVVLTLTVLMFIYLKYTKQGYEIAVVGESINTARYAGINTKKVTIRTMALSGALCGLAGFLLVSGSSHTISTGIADGRGFTAIIVSWLAKFNPFIMVVVSTLLIFLEKGSTQIATDFGLSEDVSEVLTGIILFFILGCEFFINYKLIFRHKGKEAK